MEQNQDLNAVLNKIRGTGDLDAAQGELAALGKKSQEAKLIQGINLFLRGTNYYPEAKEIFSSLYKADYKEAGYFLALVNYLTANGEDNGQAWVDLWLEENEYGGFWLAQYYLNEEFGEPDYKLAWFHLQVIPEDDGAAMALRGYLMEEQEFHLTEDLDNEVNDPQFWLAKSVKYNYSTPYGAENLGGSLLLKHIKGYINDHYGLKYKAQPRFKEPLQQEFLAQPSPYRALSFFVGGIFLLIFVILIMVQLF